MNTGISFVRIQTLDDKVVEEVLDLIQDIAMDTGTYTFGGVGDVLKSYIDGKDSFVWGVFAEGQVYGLCTFTLAKDFDFQEIRIFKFLCKGGYCKHSIADNFLEFVVEKAKKEFDNSKPSKRIIRHFPMFEWEYYTEVFVSNHFSIKSFQINDEGKLGFPIYFQRVVAP